MLRSSGEISFACELMSGLPFSSCFLCDEMCYIWYESEFQTELGQWQKKCEAKNKRNQLLAYEEEELEMEMEHDFILPTAAAIIFRKYLIAYFMEIDKYSISDK
nr:uncharacterized protein LOC123003508 [Drosophila takahashii]